MGDSPRSTMDRLFLHSKDDKLHNPLTTQLKPLRILHEGLTKAIPPNHLQAMTTKSNKLPDSHSYQSTLNPMQQPQSKSTNAQITHFQITPKVAHAMEGLEIIGAIDEVNKWLLAPVTTFPHLDRRLGLWEWRKELKRMGKCHIQKLSPDGEHDLLKSSRWGSLSLPRVSAPNHTKKTLGQCSSYWVRPKYFQTTI